MSTERRPSRRSQLLEDLAGGLKLALLLALGLLVAGACIVIITGHVVILH